MRKCFSLVGCTAKRGALLSASSMRYLAAQEQKPSLDNATVEPSSAEESQSGASSEQPPPGDNTPRRIIAPRPGWEVKTIPVADRGYRKCLQLLRRELKEEKVRPFLPPKPKVPKGWKVVHEAGTSYFTMSREWENDSGTTEHMRVFTKADSKDPEKTFRLDDGERREPEHFNFSLYISKPQTDKIAGGIEFSLSSIDNELVLDLVTMHDTKEKFEATWLANFEPRKHLESASYYRGPYINELDDDLVDELLNYLDERGVNNAFAEYIMQQSHWNEQEGYLEWMRLLCAWATPITGEIDVEVPLPPELPPAKNEGGGASSEGDNKATATAEAKGMGDAAPA